MFVRFFACLFVSPRHGAAQLQLLDSMGDLPSLVLCRERLMQMGVVCLHVPSRAPRNP